MQMVFQDPFAALNPKMRIRQIVGEPFAIHGGFPRDAIRARVAELMREVGLDTDVLERYPHEFSGGQRQRINIARALALNPRLLILDEPVSALDKSVEAQVLNLLLDLKEQFGLTYLFISHDLNVVQYVSDRVLVMYLGRIAELGPVDAIYGSAAHPYTVALLDSRPSMDPDRRRSEPPLQGDPPNPINPPSGCRFRTRCLHAEAVCGGRVPPLAPTGPTGPTGHFAACLMVLPGSGHSKARG
jgi:peptide/nickel transport system ATP-binding protein